MAWKQDATLDEALVRRLIKDGHHAMLEFGSMTVKITCSRRCSHQIVRHRLFSFAQESQRFTNYTKEVHDMAFILPPSLPADKTECFRNFCREAWLVYQKTVQDNVFPEDAAYLLPEAAVTNLCVKGNFREWRHFFILRMSQKAQLEIRTVAKALLYEIMTTPAKCVFDDLL
jgi:thymidylate synthase (FAD)